MSQSTEHVLEIRYRPTAKLLDHRGLWAEAIAVEIGLPQWNITENRIDFAENGTSRTAFLSFRNFGFVTSDSPTRNYFQDQAGKFIRAVMNLQGFATRGKLPVTRIGVRSRFCEPFPGTLDDLRRRYETRYVQFPAAMLAAIGADAKVVDLGAHINFQDSHGRFDTMTGPMNEQQFKRFFRKDEGFPAVGVFYDIDYFEDSISDWTVDAMVRKVAEFAGAASDRFDRVKALLLGT